MAAYFSFQPLNSPDRFIRHRNFRAEISTTPTPLDKKDATFNLSPGLSDPCCISFESLNFPAHYLRHRNYQLWLDPLEDSDLYRKDATFDMCFVENNLVYFESVNYPGYYIRHRDSTLNLETGTDELFHLYSRFWIMAPRCPIHNDQTAPQVGFVGPNDKNFTWDTPIWVFFNQRLKSSSVNHWTFKVWGADGTTEANGRRSSFLGGRLLFFQPEGDYYAGHPGDFHVHVTLVGTNEGHGVLQNINGVPLDGDKDGLSGGNYIHCFNILA